MHAHNGYPSVKHVCVFCKLSLRQQRLRQPSRLLSSSAPRNDNGSPPSSGSSSNAAASATVPYGSFFKKPSAPSVAFTSDPNEIRSHQAPQISTSFESRSKSSATPNTSTRKWVSLSPSHPVRASVESTRLEAQNAAMYDSMQLGKPSSHRKVRKVLSTTTGPSTNDDFRWIRPSSTYGRCSNCGRAHSSRESCSGPPPLPPKGADNELPDWGNYNDNLGLIKEFGREYGAYGPRSIGRNNGLRKRSTIRPSTIKGDDVLPSRSKNTHRIDQLKETGSSGADHSMRQPSQSGHGPSITSGFLEESSKSSGDGLQSLLRATEQARTPQATEKTRRDSFTIRRKTPPRLPQRGDRFKSRPNQDNLISYSAPLSLHPKAHSNYQDRTGQLRSHSIDELGELNGSAYSRLQGHEKPRQRQPVGERPSRLSLLLERMGGDDMPNRERGKGRVKGRSRAGKHIDANVRSFVDEDIRAKRKAFHKEKKARLAREAAAAAASRPQISLPQHISVANLATLLDVRYDQFVQQMEELGFTETAYDHVLALEDAVLIAMEYGVEPVPLESADDIIATKLPDDTSNLPIRPPIVTIMGHVDHGKTTLLDYLRKSSIAAGEHGGITQHIGAFSVPLSSGKTITFLDTPGHAAFLTMRQRGANVTDIVVLVVAADDSVMPQTIEAIKHAKAAKVPIIVAINKIDKSDANAERAKQDLARHGIQIEDYGGDTQVVCVSGKTGTGMEKLEEAIITLSEILDHRAPTDGPAEGWLLEATTKVRGRVATVLVRRGCLKPGNIIIAGRTWARVRTLRNEAGVSVDSAGPGMAVEVDGWKGQPTPGDEVLQADDEQKAAAVVRTREAVAESVKLAYDMKAINESRRQQREMDKLEAQEGKEAEDYQDRRVDGSFQEKVASSGIREVCFVIKADVVGSVEAVVNMISGLGNGEVRPHIIRSGVGDVNEGDVELAASAHGHVLAFNTATESFVRAQAAQDKVQIIEHSIIYRVAEDVNTVLAEALPPVITQRVTGEAEIAETFSITQTGKIKLLVAGCKVRNGVITKGSRVRVLRRGEIIHDGAISSLKNVKKEVIEMRKDTECGMSFDGWTSFEVGDQVQCYSETSTKRTL